jgi:hypothetical protein
MRTRAWSSGERAMMSPSAGYGDSSSTTMTSKSLKFWAKTDLSARPRMPGSFW